MTQKLIETEVTLSKNFHPELEDSLFSWMGSKERQGDLLLDAFKIQTQAKKIAQKMRIRKTTTILLWTNASSAIQL